MICSKLGLCIDEELSGKQPSKCDNSRTKCIESSDNRSNVKCEENKKKYILENTLREHVISCRMDGGIVVEDMNVPKGMNRCDYLLVDGKREKTAILVELKGVNVSDALKQISNTLVIFRDFFSSFQHVYGRAVVVSAVPNLKATPEYVKLDKALRAKYKGNLKIGKIKFSEKDVELSKT